MNSKLCFYQFEEKKTSDTEYPNDLTLTKLLSLPDKDGNTPMLFAAYKGNLDIIIKLIDLGVKYDVRNKAGLDVIQMAAQNDMANVIIFFKEKYNYDLFMPDLMGNNALHWIGPAQTVQKLLWDTYYFILMIKMQISLTP